MNSLKINHYIKLYLIGDPNVGKSALCRAWNPAFAPLDGYHVHHSGNNLDVLISNVSTSPNQSCNTSLSIHSVPEPRVSPVYVTLITEILNPYQEGDHARLTPLVLLRTDVVGLCYKTSDSRTLDNVVRKWLPFVKHHLPRVPILLIGYHAISTSDKADEHVQGVSQQQIDNALNQTTAVHSLQWSHNANPDNAVTSSSDIAKIVAWYGYHSSLHSASSTDKRCIIS